MAHIRQRKLSDGKVVYSIEVSINDTEHGMKPYSKSMTFTPDPKLSPKQAEKAAHEKAKEFEKEIKEKYYAGFNKENITFRQFAEVYKEYSLKAKEITTCYREEPVIKTLVDYFGDIELNKFNPKMIQAFFDYIESRRKVTITVQPKKDFKQKIFDYGYNYTILRHSLKIQHTTLSAALAGNNVSIEWANDFCKKTKMPFTELFIKHETKEPYSYNTNHKPKAMLRAMLAYAKRMQYIEINYATSDFVVYEKRSSEDEELEVMSFEQVNILYHYLVEQEKDIRVKTSLMLFILTGCRRAEIAGLKWEDINLEEGTISIKRTLTTVTGHGVIEKDPKTRNSKRVIDIPEDMVNQLNLYLKWQHNYQYQMQDKYKDEGWVFIKSDGDHIHPDKFNKYLDDVLKKAGLPHFTIHSLRHTNITLQIESGVPVTTVSSRAGHSRTSTTTDIYAYAFKNSNKEASNILQSRLNDTIQAEAINTDERNEYRKAKEEMKKLGFTNMREYLDFVEYRKMKGC